MHDQKRVRARVPGKCERVFRMLFGICLGSRMLENRTLGTDRGWDGKGRGLLVIVAWALSHFPPRVPNRATAVR